MIKQSDIIKIILIYLVSLLIVSWPFKAEAFDYDVDFPTSGNGKHVMAITINGCETRFSIEDKNLEAFSKKVNDDDKTREQLINAALKRANNGCK